MKKLLAGFLAVILIFSGTLTVFAHEEPVEAYEEVVCEAFDDFNVLVVTYDSKYSEKGKLPKVELKIWYEKDQAHKFVESEQEDIIQELYVYEGENYPQIFIRLPKEMALVKGIKLESGAFATADGEMSKEVELSNSKYNHNTDFELLCRSTGFVKRQVWNRTVKDHIINGSTVDTNVRIKSAYAKVWKANATLSASKNKQAIEVKDGTIFDTEKSGKYTVEYRLNDFLCVTKEFKSTSNTGAYFLNLGDSFLLLLTTPFYLLLSIIMILVPGFGWVLGGFSLTSVGFSFSNFFSALFEGANVIESGF